MTVNQHYTILKRKEKTGFTKWTTLRTGAAERRLSR